MLNKKYTCVKVDQQKDGITWVTFNRPEKRNAMSPTFHREMMEIMKAHELAEIAENPYLTVLPRIGGRRRLGRVLQWNGPVQSFCEFRRQSQ